MTALKHSTANPDELNHFARLSETWWEEEGPLSALHALNPLRLHYIKDHVGQQFGSSLRHQRVLDVGCGGGLLCEPLTRLGAEVTGLDASPENIQIAQAHAHTSRLNITYVHDTIESWAPAHPQHYDVITALEILEHVDHPDLFIASCAEALRSGGLLFLSTFHRTPKSFLLGIVMAEYILGWAPKGTHTWRKFIKPSEMNQFCARAGLHLIDLVGVHYHPITSQWSLTQDPRVNYMAVFEKR